MTTGRRSFLQSSVTLTAAALTGSLTKTKPTVAQQVDDLFKHMKWLNDPASWKKNGDQLIVRSRPKTDFWRKTFYGYITDNGHFFHFPVTGDFTLEARVNGQYTALYDQAGLMVRLDAESWMKCGTEFFDGRRHASVVVTRDFSDWSSMPDLSDTAAVWWRALRKKDSIETHCSLDGKSFTTVRQGYFPPNVQVDVGIMCAAPEGPGFEAVFDHLKLKTS
jgi:uncharacterized protein